jgi:ribokinase
MSRLLVLGNAGLDFSLPVPRMPRPGETLVGGERRVAPGGKGLNQAVVACRTGLLPVDFLAPLGRDPEAAMVEAVLQAEGFAVLTLPRPGPATDCSVLLVQPDGENSIVTSGACAAALGAEAAASAVTALPPDAWLLLQGNLTAEATRAALRTAAAAGIQAVLNPAPLFWDMRAMLPDCMVVIANAGEALELTGAEGEAAALALHRAGPWLAIVTLGAAGCVIATAGSVRHFSAPAVAAVDSTGAGDTFCGVCAAMLALGAPVDAVITAAQQAACLTVQRPGAFAALPDAAELQAILRRAR